MGENELKNNPSQKELRIFYENQGGGIKETCNIPENLLYHKADIKSDSKIILIGPDGGKRRERDGYFMPNLHNGLFRIHAFLYDNQIKSAMLNCDVDNMEDAWEMIARFTPPFIAFSPYYDTINNDLKNIEHALDISPDSIIIIGGFEASLNTQWREMGGLIDIIIRGEGEFPLREIVQRHEEFFKDNKGKNKKDFLKYLEEDIKTREIPGVIILEQGKKAEISVVNERIDEESYQKINLNAFQKHLDISPIGRYWELSRAMFGGKKDSYFRFVTSDHCPYKCIFCQSSIYYSTILGKCSSPLRYIYPDNILKIIKAVSEKYPLMDIYIDDDNFLVNQLRAIETLNKIIESKKSGEIRENLIFQCRARTDNINPEICSLLKRAGFKTISVGSESYSMKELDYMRKKNTPEINMNAVKTILDYGMEVAEDFLLFTPLVTPDTFYENALGICRNIEKFGNDCSVNLFLSPLPSTELWGDGYFEKVEESPYKEFFKDKIMFKNPHNGYEYLGTEIRIPRLGIVLPHPEMVLVKDPVMCQVSLREIKYLEESVDSLRKIANEINLSLSRNFATLSHLLATSNALYDLTKEKRWEELRERIKKSIIAESNRRKD